MNVMICEGLPLGLSWIEILIHILNFFVLLIGIRFLLYKPIKKFMIKRQEEYKKADEESKELKKEAEAKKEEYNALIDSARQEAVKISEEATAAANVQKKEIIKEAQSQAKDIIEKAKIDINNEKLKAKEELLYSVSELYVDIATKILEREVKLKDNDEVINSLIEDWKKDA